MRARQHQCWPQNTPAAASQWQWQRQRQQAISTRCRSKLSSAAGADAKYLIVGLPIGGAALHQPYCAGSFPRQSAVAQVRVHSSQAVAATAACTSLLIGFSALVVVLSSAQGGGLGPLFGRLSLLRCTGVCSASWSLTWAHTCAMAKTNGIRWNYPGHRPGRAAHRAICYSGANRRPAMQHLLFAWLGGSTKRGV
jgi:hypothetical protein